MIINAAVAEFLFHFFRVLKPPGGGSSFSIGGAQEDPNPKTTAKEQEAPKQPTPVVDVNATNSSRVTAPPGGRSQITFG